MEGRKRGSGKGRKGCEEVGRKGEGEKLDKGRERRKEGSKGKDGSHYLK
jgi:hypothetical protein